MHIVKFVKTEVQLIFLLKGEMKNMTNDPALQEFISWDEKLQSFKTNNGYKNISS